MTNVHLIFRTLFRLLRPTRGRELGHFDVCETKFMVLPTDLDVADEQLPEVEADRVPPRRQA